MKRELLNRAEIKVYFEDGASLTWSIKRGGAASRSRAVLADELIRFAERIRPQAVSTEEAAEGRPRHA